MAFVTPVVEHWLEREIAQWVDLTTHHTMSECSYQGGTTHSLEYRGLMPTASGFLT